MSSYKDRNSNFVNYICKQCSSNKGIAAHLRRADQGNPDPIVFATLVKFGLDITKESEFLPFSMVAAAIARGKKYENGSHNFIQLLASVEKCSTEKKEKDDARIRRLLACNSLSDLVLIFRPIMSLVQNRSNYTIDYETLLDDLCLFENEACRVLIKKKWATLFYRTNQGNELSGE